MVNEDAPPELGAVRSSVSSLDGVALDHAVSRVENSYFRSADAIQQQVCQRLSDDEQLDASGVLVSVSDGEVILEGCVSDRPAMQRAEHIARSVEGVTEVYNRVEVEKSVLAELGDRIFGSGADKQNHSGSGTKNAPNVRV
jgi:osmotically-inducible protein OsmY